MKRDAIERKRNETALAGQKCESMLGGTGWKIIGGAALVLLVAGVAATLPDIKRYIKISTM